MELILSRKLQERAFSRRWISNVRPHVVRTCCLARIFSRAFVDASYVYSNDLAAAQGAGMDNSVATEAIITRLIAPGIIWNFWIIYTRSMKKLLESIRKFFASIKLPKLKKQNHKLSAALLCLRAAKQIASRSSVGRDPIDRCRHAFLCVVVEINPICKRPGSCSHPAPDENPPEVVLPVPVSVGNGRLPLSANSSLRQIFPNGRVISRSNIAFRGGDAMLAIADEFKIKSERSYTSINRWKIIRII